jgi:hypothetical protein
MNIARQVAKCKILVHKAISRWARLSHTGILPHLSFETNPPLGVNAHAIRVDRAENLILTRRTLSEALARYYQSVYNCNMALGRIRLVTACDEYQTFVESGGSDARVLDDAGRAAARDYRR